MYVVDVSNSIQRLINNASTMVPALSYVQFVANSTLRLDNVSARAEVRPAPALCGALRPALPRPAASLCLLSRDAGCPTAPEQLSGGARERSHGRASN